MDLKISITILMFQMCIYSYFPRTIETLCRQQESPNETFHVRPASKFSFDIFSAALQTISATTSNLVSAYSNNELHNAGDVAYTIIESIPVVGDIVSVFISSPENQFEIERNIHRIHETLQEINQEIISTGEKVDHLSKQLDLSLIQTQVAEDVRQIQDCHSNFLLFLMKPTLKAEQERLIKCYDKFGYTREIGNILNDEKVTFAQKPLFVQIIDNLGYCNGSQVQSVFKYLLGLYIEGCTATVAAEALKYNKTSLTYQDECKRTIKRSQAHLPTVLKKCSQVPCDNVYKVIGKIVLQSNISAMSYILNETFPWFFFTTLIFKVKVKANIKFYEGTLNRLILTNETDVYGVVLWQSFRNINVDGDNQYGVEYNDDAYRGGFNHISLISVRGSERSLFIGFHRGNESSVGQECNHTMDVGHLGRQVLTENNTSLSNVAIAMTAVGSIAFILIVALCTYCCRRHCSCDEEDEVEFRTGNRNVGHEIDDENEI